MFKKQVYLTPFILIRHLIWYSYILLIILKRKWHWITTKYILIILLQFAHFEYTQKDLISYAYNTATRRSFPDRLVCSQIKSKITNNSDKIIRIKIYQSTIYWAITVNCSMATPRFLIKRVSLVCVVIPLAMWLIV